jgi:hypothetical protein
MKELLGESLPEPKEDKREAQIREARHKLVESVGVTVGDEAFPLNKDAQLAISDKDFGMPARVVAETSTKILETEGGQAMARRRVDHEVADQIRGGQYSPGDAFELLPPVDPKTATYLDSHGLRSAEASLSRATAVIEGIRLMGGRGEGINNPFMKDILKNAQVAIYNSPENGAVTLEQRTIEIPGGGTIVEMNAMAVGRDEVLGSQVVMIPDIPGRVA